MIKTKRELFEYLEADAKANGRSKVRSNVYGDEIWKFIRCLRKMNYYDYLRSQGSLFGKAAFFVVVSPLSRTVCKTFVFYTI